MVGAYFTLRIIINFIAITAAYMKNDVKIISYRRELKDITQKGIVLIIIIWTIFIQLL